MPLLQEPAELTDIDLEELAGLGVPPEYVVAFTPPRAYKLLWYRLTMPGWWELLTVADYHTGDHAIEEWTWDAPRDASVADLTDWVTGLLGLPVALEKDEAPLPAGAPRTEPLYWVLRNT